MRFYCYAILLRCVFPTMRFFLLCGSTTKFFFLLCGLLCVSTTLRFYYAVCLLSGQGHRVHFARVALVRTSTILCGPCCCCMGCGLHVQHADRQPASAWAMLCMLRVLSCPHRSQKVQQLFFQHPPESYTDEHDVKVLVRFPPGSHLLQPHVYSGHAWRLLYVRLTSDLHLLGILQFGCSLKVFDCTL